MTSEGGNGTGGDGERQININTQRFGALLKPPSEFNMNVENKAEAWKKWKRQFQFFTDASGLSEEQPKVQVGTLMTCLGEGVLDIYDTFEFEDGEEDQIQIVLSKFEEVFKMEKGNETQERQIFYTMKQGSKKFNDFLSELQIQAKKCNFGEAQSSMIRDQIIRGIKEDSTREKLHMKKDLDLKAATEICRTQERIKSLMSEFKNSTKEVDIVKKSDEKKDKVKTADSTTAVDCGKCGRKHEKKKCPAYGATCFTCNGKNHYSKCCFKKKSFQKKASTVETEEEQDEVSMVNLRLDTVRDKGEDWFQVILVNGKKLNVKLDTGAQCNVVSRTTALQLGFDKVNKSVTKSIVSFNNVKTPVLGEFTANCSTSKGNTVPIKFKVIDTDVCPILGRDSCVKMNLIQRVEEITMEEDIFNGVGCLKNFKYRLEFKENPEFEISGSRNIPHALRDEVKSELDSMMNLGVIEKVKEASPVVSNMVVVKRNGKIRVCLDPTNLNKNLLRRHFPMRTIDQIAARIVQAKWFTVLDCRKGFWHIEVDEVSRPYLTFITPWGRFRYCRMPPGISSAPEVFQEQTTSLLEEVSENAEVSMDDVLLFHSTLDGLKALTKKVMKKFYEAGLRLNKEKCQFFKQKVKFLGHWITKDGMMADDEKIKAIHNLRQPKTKKEIQRLLGSVNYLSKFIQNSSDLTAPLRRLLPKDIVFAWGPEQKEAFEKIKHTLTNLPLLRYYDVNAEVTVSVDSSSVAMGAVLLQGDQPVYYASKALTDTQQTYPQIEKEALAIKFGLNRFHDFVYGKKITVESDHKPLEAIWKKPIHRAPPRLKKIMLDCMRYPILVVYKKGKDIPLADILSRDVENEPPDPIEESLEVNVVIDMRLSWYKEIKEATGKDEKLIKLQQIIQTGWPENLDKVPDNLKKYVTFRDELSVVDGVIFKSDKVLIPEGLQLKAMRLNHDGHFGYENCIKRAKETMFWIGMGSDIREFVQHCTACQK